MAVFDTNLAFKWLGISLGDFDGKEFRRNKTQYFWLFIYSGCWYLSIAYDIIRMIILIIIPRDTIYGFYLLDFVSLELLNVFIIVQI